MTNSTDSAGAGTITAAAAATFPHGLQAFPVIKSVPPKEKAPGGSA